mmetsp:Transcript_28889/g.47782  ORF Transcript_28889/g.47782 Transcript_28889/m.47782 type:complete len:344 (-) Transcript_28889:39-1070(-)
MSAVIAPKKQFHFLWNARYSGIDTDLHQFLTTQIRRGLFSILWPGGAEHQHLSIWSHKLQQFFDVDQPSSCGQHMIRFIQNHIADAFGADPTLHAYQLQEPSGRGDQDLGPAPEVRRGLHGRLLLRRHAAKDDACPKAVFATGPITELLCHLMRLHGQFSRGFQDQRDGSFARLQLRLRHDVDQGREQKAQRLAAACRCHSDHIKSSQRAGPSLRLDGEGQRIGVFRTEELHGQFFHEGRERGLLESLKGLRRGPAAHRLYHDALRLPILLRIFQGSLPQDRMCFLQITKAKSLVLQRGIWVLEIEVLVQLRQVPLQPIPIVHRLTNDSPRRGARRRWGLHVQ